jgi:actin-related protein
MESVGKIFFQSLMQFDGETRKGMWENIVMFGGTSAAQGIADRVKRELAPLLPSRATVKIVQTKPKDRVVSSWIGGSIVASTSDFVSNLCLTKAKYEEEGIDRALLFQELFQ